jgi:hypothetical protein
VEDDDDDEGASDDEGDEGEEGSEVNGDNGTRSSPFAQLPSVSTLLGLQVLEYQDDS